MRWRLLVQVQEVASLSQSLCGSATPQPSKGDIPLYRRLAPLQLVYGLNERKHLGIGLQMQGRYAAASAYITATKRNPPDARALDHLEEMFLYTPEINDMLPTIDEDLAECRDLVAREGSRTSWQLLLDA